MNFPVPVQLLLVFYVANLILSALVQALPEPDTNSSKFYIFFYKFFSLVVSDFKSFAGEIPVPTLTTTSGAIVETTKPNPNPSTTANSGTL